MAKAMTAADDAFVSDAPRLGLVRGFDGLRGFGVMIVLVGHLFPEYHDSFNPMVDVFFVLSAFLIVTLLMQERRDNGQINLRKFYARRAIRLLPNSYACMLAWLAIWMLVKATGVEMTSEGGEQVARIPGEVLAGATYTYHLAYPLAGQLGPMVQFWSLSLEEQFYLFAGFATVFTLAMRRRAAAACVVMVAAVLWIWWARWNMDFGPWPGQDLGADSWHRGISQFWLVRPDALLVGVLLAFLNARLPDPLSDRAKKILATLAWIGFFVCLFVLSSSLEGIHKLGWPIYLPGQPRGEIPYQLVDGTLWCGAAGNEPLKPCTDTLWMSRWAFNVMGIASAPVVLACARLKTGKLSSMLSWKRASSFGMMSYSLYVWHLLAYALVGLFTAGLGRGPDAVLKFAGAIGISWLAHRYIDETVLKAKMKFSTEKVVLDRVSGKEVRLEDIEGASAPVAAPPDPASKAIDDNKPPKASSD